jgi:hypothetical protein
VVRTITPYLEENEHFETGAEQFFSELNFKELVWKKLQGVGGPRGWSKSLNV